MKFKSLFLAALVAMCFIGCDLEGTVAQQKTSSGISSEDAKSKIKVKKQADGMTLEQANIVNSYKVENRPKATKHLYVISPYTGSVLIYSTVAGKVTSNTKGLQPSTVVGTDGQHVGYASMGIPVTVHGKKKYTTEVMNESGTYGTSKPNYIYWWDTRGVYHKHFVTGGQMIHISDQPMPVRDVILNMNKVIK